MNSTDKKIVSEMGRQISKTDSHIRTSIEAQQPDGLRTEIVVLVNLWSSVWDLRNRDGASKGVLRLLAQSTYTIATENHVKDREWNLTGKVENAARLLVSRPKMAVDTAEIFIDYWANLKMRDEDRIEVRTRFISAINELLGGIRTKPIRSLLRADSRLSVTSKLSLFSRSDSGVNA